MNEEGGGPGKSGRTRTMISFDGRGDSELKEKICNGEKSPRESRRKGLSRCPRLLDAGGGRAGSFPLMLQEY